MANPKVLVGCPTSDHKAYCLDAYAERVKALTYDNYDILLVDNSETDAYVKKIKAKGLPVERVPYTATARDRIVRARNKIRDVVLTQGYDYFFSLEQDVIPPVDVIKQLLARKKDVVSGVYFKEFTYPSREGGMKTHVLPLAYESYEPEKDLVRQLKFKDVQEAELKEISSCGVGCIMIRKAVLEKVTFRYVPEKTVFDDIWFCKDARKAGYTIYLDTAVKCKHLTKGMDWDAIQQ